jgi:hypothetical protein
MNKTWKRNQNTQNLFQLDKAHNEIESFTKSETERDNHGGAPVVVIGFVGGET